MLQPVPCELRVKPLAVCVATIFALSTPLAMATWTVDTCSEGMSGDAVAKTGSLRFAVANAAPSGETIDLTHLPLACSVISLSTGAIAVTESDLTINGPGIDALTITRDPAGTQDRIFTHTGTGTLLIKNLSINSGYLFPYGDANGGCVYSSGSVSLDHVRVAACKATSLDSTKGGGVYTAHDLTMTSSILDGNTATSGVYATVAEGGGAEVLGNFVANYSTISNNQVVAAVSTLGFGGGLSLHDDVTIAQSTISGNSSSLSAGGIFTVDSVTRYVTIKNSTISGNKAINGVVGGIISNAGAFTLASSTIAFNSAEKDFYTPNNYSAGLTLLANAGNITAQLKSNLLAYNSYGANIPDDLSTAKRLSWGITLTASGTNPAFHNNNLISANRDGRVPQDTIASACPLLGPLRDNGGPTKTHALLSGSPAIDAGSNVFHLPTDQRGFARPLMTVAMPTPVADIGAYEVQQGDIIFSNGFEAAATCP
jgi:hypothetical protein